jgi:dTMP kinase
MRTKGFFICLEGLDGCGKTTQTRLLARTLRKRRYDVTRTTEPSRGKIGRFVKRYFLHGEERGSYIVEALLFAADRFEHVEKEIIPCLKEGRIVVSDRYVYSSFAYQGATGLDLNWIRTLNKNAIRPDLAIFIDAEPTTAVKRLKLKKSVMENLKTQKKVRDIYLKFVDGGELVRVDGNRSEKEVAKAILETVIESLQQSS